MKKHIWVWWYPEIPEFILKKNLKFLQHYWNWNLFLNRNANLTKMTKAIKISYKNITLKCYTVSYCALFSRYIITRLSYDHTLSVKCRISKQILSQKHWKVFLLQESDPLSRALVVQFELYDHKINHGFSSCWIRLHFGRGRYCNKT